MKYKKLADLHVCPSRKTVDPREKNQQKRAEPGWKPPNLLIKMYVRGTKNEI